MFIQSEAKGVNLAARQACCAEPSYRTSLCANKHTFCNLNIDHKGSLRMYIHSYIDFIHMHFRVY